jgi:hypothetical protein
MTMRASLALLALAAASASGADSAAKKYTPEIHGQLTSGRGVAPNVCLRQSDSEIRNCGYPDASGRFLIPSAPVRRVIETPDGATAKPLTFWLETGNVQKPEKLWPIDAVADRNAAIDIQCDLSRADRTGSTYRACETKAAKPLVVRVERDDTPYRMVHPGNPAQ